VVYAVAGRSAFLDGGMVLWRIHATTGEPLSQTPITTAALPDVLSSDGESVFLRHRRFDLEGVEQPANVPHLYSPAGFLDDSWWHRTYWLLGTTMRSGWGAWPDSGNRVPAGRILVAGEQDVYGFGRFNQYHRDGSHVGLGQTRYLLFASPIGAAKRPAGAGAAGNQAGGAPQVAARWTRTLPLLVRGMVLCGETLFVAGPLDVFTYPPEAATDRYQIGSPEALRRQEAALAGRAGAVLMVVSTKDGSELARYRLEAPPQWDALAAAAGRLYATTTDGKVICLAGAK
jgi:hypothetical protein